MANIFAEFAQPVRSISDYQNDYDKQALVRGQLAGQTRVNALADLTADQTRQTMADTQHSNALIKAAYGVKPNATDDDVIQALRGSGNRGALEYAGKLEEQRGKRDETVAKTREAQAKAMSEISGSVKRMATGLMSNPTQESALAMVSNIEALHKHFGIPVNFDSERQQIMAMTSPDQVRKYAAGEMGDANLMLAKLTAHNNGKVTAFTDTNPITNPAGPAPITMTTTPGEDSTAATARAGQAVTLAGQRSTAQTAANALAQGERHFTAQQNAPKYMETDAGLVSLPTRLTPGQVPVGQPVAGADGQPLGKPLKALPPAVNEAIISNAQSLYSLDKAISLLQGKKVESANGDQAATGWKGYLPQAVLNRVDPSGVDTRAELSDIGSLKIHDRSGAAVTVSESPRLMPFIPQSTDPPEVAIRKLTRLREEAQRNQQALSDTYSKEQGYRPSPVKPGAARAGAAPVEAGGFSDAEKEARYQTWKTKQK